MGGEVTIIVSSSGPGPGQVQVRKLRNWPEPYSIFGFHPRVFSVLIQGGLITQSQKSFGWLHKCSWHRPGSSGRAEWWYSFTFRIFWHFAIWGIIIPAMHLTYLRQFSSQMAKVTELRPPLWHWTLDTGQWGSQFSHFCHLTSIFRLYRNLNFVPIFCSNGKL